MFRVLLTLLFSALLFPSARSELRVIPIPDDVRTALGLPEHYRKMATGGGLPVVGSGKVSDYALLEAAWIVRCMLDGRPDIRDAMAARRVRVAVMAVDEYTTDLPEHSGLKPALYWDRRARGLGATPHNPVVSCGEENLLGYPNDPYAAENILVHEFAHAIHDTGLIDADPGFDGLLGKAYARAILEGKWKGMYAGTNRHEYWAEAVQSWFDDNRENDTVHNHVNTRTELQEYDPGVAELCARVFRNGSWRYVRPSLRPESDRAHLAGFDPAAAPAFRWREVPVGPTAAVRLETDAGDIEIEINAAAAPVTAANFLRYVTDGFYHGGQFHRTVRNDNQPDNPVRIEVIQAAANPKRAGEKPPPIPLERTQTTGLSHVDGTISMARDGPDTAQDEFFICIGDQPELDFGGKRNPDGQGFAAFGRVVKGMDVVREIQQSTADGQKLNPPVTIRAAWRIR